MKTLKRISMSLFVITVCVLQAQGKTKGKISDPGPKMPSVILSAGYGNTIPSSTTKDAYFINSSGITGDLFVPFLLFRKGWDGTVKGGKFGFNIGGTYNFGGNGNPNTPLPLAFPITGQTASSVAYKGVDPKNPGFRIGGGPQVNFSLGDHFIISPMVLAEYFSTTQKSLSAVQTTQVNGQTKEYNLLTLPETKTTGFSVTPKMRMSYFFGDNFGIFADAGYIFGPKANTQTTSLKPEGNPNQAGQYNQQQLDQGTQVKGEVKSNSYQAFAVNVGLSMAFGGKKGWNGITESAQNTNDNGNKTSSGCSCVASPTGDARISIPGSASANFGSTLNIPYDINNTSRNIIVTYNPHTYQTLYTGIWSTTIQVLVNGSASFGVISRTSPSGTTNNYLLNNPGSMQFSFNELHTGINTVQVVGYCSGGSPCNLGTITINVAPPPAPASGNITLVKNCCKRNLPGGGHLSEFTGQVSFTMGGTATSAVLEITTPSGGTIYEAFVPGGTTACYTKPVTIKLVDIITHVPVSSSTINGILTNTLKYSPKFDVSCMNKITVSMIPDLGKILVGDGSHHWDTGWTTATEIDRTAVIADDPDGHRIITTFTNPRSKEIITVKSIVDINEKGDMNLIKAEQASSNLNGITKPIEVLNSKANQYVGHVTLLR